MALSNIVPLIQEYGPLRTEIDTIGASTFYGFAFSNSTTTANASWLIIRETVAGSATEVIYASEFFNQVWDDRASLFANPPFENNNSVFFQAGNERMLVGDVADLEFSKTDAFSISAWFRTNTTGQLAIASNQGASNTDGWRLVTNTNRVDFHLSESNSDRFEMRTPAVSSADDTWNHVVIMYDGSNADTGFNIVYNGVDQTLSSNGSSTITTTLDYTGVNAYVGIRNVTVNDFIGFIDEVGVWSTGLSVAEAQTVYNSGSALDLLNSGPQAVSLIHWWRMGDNDTFPTIADLGTGGNNGTLENMISSAIVGEAAPI